MSGAVGFAPLEFLITLLINISRMDSDGFFDEPVREEDAPGYYNVIKQPMCFQRMKEKVSNVECIVLHEGGCFLACSGALHACQGLTQDRLACN